jgi:hypothetical protein
MRMRRHKLKERRANNNKPVQLAQVEGKENILEMLSQRKKKSVASVKAPSDLKKFSLVQINNQAPPPKKQKVKPGKKTPPSSNLIQTDQKIKLTE